MAFPIFSHHTSLGNLMHNFIVHAVGTRNPSSHMLGELPVNHLAIALFNFPDSLKDKCCQYP